MAVVDVADVANAVYKSAIIPGLHGKNYLLSSETYPVSDISLMLNQKAPKNQAEEVYRNRLATQDLHITFKPVQQTLARYSN